jgi:hypothetical protein
VLARSVRHACTHGHRADTESDTAIPLPLVESPILSKVIEYCTWHVKAESDGTSKDAKNDWSAKFVDVDQGTLFHLILAANYRESCHPTIVLPSAHPFKVALLVLVKEQI